MDEPTLLLLDKMSETHYAEILEKMETTCGASSDTERISKPVFKKILAASLDVKPSDKRLGTLVNRIDADGKGIDKQCFLDFLHFYLKEKNVDILRPPTSPLQPNVTFKQNTFSKQSSCKILQATNLPHIFTVSKDGVITTWSTSLVSQRGNIADDYASVAMRTQLNYQRRTLVWVTDTALMTEANILVTATTSREMCFYNVAAPVYRCQAKIHKMPSTALCLTTSISTTNGSTVLFYGDDKGYIVLLSFRNPLVSLFKSKPIDEDEKGFQKILYSKLPHHTPYVTLTILSTAHPDWVLNVLYVPHNNTIISSCSGSGKQSLVIQHIDNKWNPYIFNITKGVCCFDYSHELNLLVTGSSDHTLRYWDPCVTSKPTAVLTRHLAPIVDTLIHTVTRVVFTFSQDASLFVWSVKDPTLLQMITVKFPFSLRPRDYDHKVLHLLAPSILTVSSNEHIGEYNITLPSATGSGKQGMVKSHSKPLIGVVYDQRYYQVISGCERGDIIVWDLQTGLKRRLIDDAHQGHEMTCMSISCEYRRIMTGSANGQIKMWDHNTGACLKYACTPGVTMVTGVGHHLDKKMLFSVGWNKQISVYSDIVNPYTFQMVREIDVLHSRPGLYEEDITAMHMENSYIATGCYDGQIVIWYTEKETPLAIMKSDHTGCSPCHCPVDSILLLPERLKKDKEFNIAVFVTSENGHALFWSLSTCRVIGKFCISSTDRSVFAMCTNKTKENLLICGDSAGYVSIYDIKKYCNGALSAQVPSVSSTWQAHSQKITSIKHIDKRQSFIVTASSDCTVRLWNASGHYVGVFGQEYEWNLTKPNSFQHPKTPFSAPVDEDASTEDTIVKIKDDKPLPAVINIAPSVDSSTSSCSINGARPKVGPLLGRPLASNTINMHPHSRTTLPPIANGELYRQYGERACRRMEAKVTRRREYAAIDVKVINRDTLKCSPYQALKLQEISITTLPKK